VILLALLVAGGVFAQQGSWSLGGGVQIGTRIDFDPIPGDPDTMASVRAEPFIYWQGVDGSLSMTYSRDAVSAGLNLSTAAVVGEASTSFLSFSGDNYNAYAQISGMPLMRQGAWGNQYINQLWGTYKFVNGMVGMDVAYKAGWARYWESDTSGLVAYDIWAALAGERGNKSGSIQSSDFFGNGDPFAVTDAWMRLSMLRPYVDIANINFGILIPNLFRDDRNESGETGDLTWTGWYNHPNSADKFDNVTNRSQNLLVENVLKMSVFGIKFDLHPIEFAAQFRLRNYGVYFGGRFNTGPVTFGLSFKGDLIPENDDTGKDLSIGANVEYDAGVFGANLRAFLGREIAPVSLADMYQQVIGVQPGFFYKIIPSHLGFVLNTGFYFTDWRVNGDSVSGMPDVIWAVEPNIFWNFLGTGAATADWGVSTGMMIRYRLVSEFNIWGEPDVGKNSANFLDVTFKWGF